VYKINNSLRSSLLLGAATAAAVSMSGAALAQSSSNVETVVVTGSRIPQQGIVSASPVTAVGQTEMKFEGTTNVENLLNNLPSVVADFTEAASNGATGQATVDLRGLGSERTLVLVDGKRLMPSDPTNPVADLNQIPAALVDHVEVLTGGASAVYGSDAEAGVVNFIMRKDFEGIELDGQLGIDEAGNGNSTYRGLQTTAGFAQAPENWWGGRTNDATLIFGANTANGKGNVTAYIGFRDIQGVTQNKRDYSDCSISTGTTGGTTNPPGFQYCAGSSNKNRWFSIDDVALGNTTTNYYDFFENGTGSPGTGQLVPYTGVPAQKYNYGAVNYIQRPDSRYIGGFDAHYQVDKSLDFYANFMFSDDHTLAQIAPSGLFLGTGKAPGYPGYVEVNCDNPLMTAQENASLCATPGSNLVSTGAIATALGHPYYDGAGNIVTGQSLLEIGRRDLEGGDRIDDLRHTAYRMVIGAKGDLNSAWSYDAYAQYGITLYSETYDNEFSVTRVQNALQVDPTTGQCMGTDPSCVPLDIFNGIGSITPKMLNYVLAQGFKQGYTEEMVVSASMTGDLSSYGVKSPWANDGVAVAFGSEWRKETLELKVSRDFQINDLYGQGGATLPVPASSFNVAEGFGEITIPIAQGQPFIQDLSFNGGFRYSAYSTAGDVWSYKMGLQYQPIDDVRLRSSYERAVRAPNVLDLFSPFNVDLFGGSDPCAGTVADPTVLANCHAHGASHANVGAGIQQCVAAQCDQQVGGNLALKPEESDTYSIGAVFTPSFLTGFTATVDYFSIKVNHYIAGPNPNVTLSACYGVAATAASQAIACPLVVRSASGQSIWASGYVIAQTENTGGLETKGVDTELNYQVDLDDFGLTGAGSLNANLIGTYTDSLTTQPFPGYLSYNCAGFYGVTCGTPTPKWRHKMRVTWDSPWDFQFSIAWRHLSGSKLDLNTNNPLLNGACGDTTGVPCPDVVDGKIPSYDYFDIAGTWEVSKGLELRAGINNLFDKDPPVLDSNNYGITGPSQFGNGNTYPGAYDPMGRTMYLGITAKY
jgi:outer membrane receptor protein involved in Fe transport